MTNHEIKALTSLRWLPASLVFAYHFPSLFNEFCPPSLQFIGNTGNIGVNFFFVLSGFILTLRYHDDMLERHFNLGMYMRRRIARIYPLYFTILILTSILNREPPNIQNLTLTQG